MCVLSWVPGGKSSVVARIFTEHKEIKLQKITSKVVPIDFFVHSENDISCLDTSKALTGIHYKLPNLAFVAI